MKNVLLQKTFLFRMEFYKIIHFYLRNLVKHNQRILAVIKNLKVLKLNLDSGNWNEGDQFELFSENGVLEIPA